MSPSSSRRLAVGLLLAAALCGLPVSAQAPDAPWRTLRTAHFRLHYPASSEGWTRRAAARLESIWSRVEAEVGYRPPEIVDVIVSDPVAEPNGAALPILGWPRMLLWTSPPGPESVLGHYSDWSELLLVHEGTHLAHLLRPSRNPLQRLLGRLLPLGPLVRKSPRWVTEGYATVIEGRLTASGRPNGDLRAAVLRRRAQQGKLPSYGGLNSDRSWLGSSMAYLAGSAYLEWLDQRAGPGSLPKLWARMSARQERSFDDAFKGVYGDSPSDLYGRFSAELTYHALEAEQRIAPALREGDLWQDLSWTTGAPALSRQGDRLAIVRGGRDDPDELVVWSTAPDEKAEAEWKKERDEIAAKDPEDVPAVRTKPLGRDPLFRLPTVDGIEPTTPRWLADGKSILFVRFEPDARGFLHPDLFRWTLPGEGGSGGDGGVDRLTRGADLRQPDPAPDGTWAVALRNRDGASQLVRVDLASGEVTAVTEPSLDIVYDQPRVSPDGLRLAFAVHREGLWRLVVRDLATGEERELAPPQPEDTVSAPAWSGDGKALYAVVGRGGFIDVWSFPVGSEGPPIRVTRTQGAALAPAPTPDGKALFFLTLQPDGLDLHRLDLETSAASASAAGGPAPPTPPAAEPSEETAATSPQLAPAVRPVPPPTPAPFELAEVPAGKPYGLGRLEVSSLSNVSVASSGQVVDLGVRAGDIIGRLDLLALGALGGDAGPEGGALAAAWRGPPLALSFHLFSTRETPSRQRGDRPGGVVADRGLDIDRQGLELRAEWQRRYGPSTIRLASGGLWARIDPRISPSGSSSEEIDETIGFLEARYDARRSRGKWWWNEGLGGHLEHSERHDGAGNGWDRYGGSATVGLGRDDDGLILTYRRDGSSGDLLPFDLFTVGGESASVLPRAALANRVRVPALPVGALVGEDYEGERAELHLDALPLPLFYERHRVGDGDGAWGDWLSLAGLEWRFSTGPVPLGRIPALDFRVGVGKILDTPEADRRLDDDWRWWLTTVVRP